MKNEMRGRLAGALGIALMLAANWVFASDASVTVFPAEGNKTCSDYSSNKLILAMGTTAPTPSVGGIQLYGAENPRDADSAGESAAYVLSADGKTLSFSAATTPVDYAVLKSGTSVAVLVYPAGGVKGDANMAVRGTSGNLAISAFNLCYGLGNSALPPPPVAKAKTPNCSTLTDGLDGQVIACSNTTHPVLLCSMELDQAFFGMKSGDTCCVCNHDELVECDPSLVEGAEGACPSAAYEPKEVTTSIEINKDPYYCTTVGGTKRCYTY